MHANTTLHMYGFKGVCVSKNDKCCQAKLALLHCKLIKQAVKTPTNKNASNIDQIDTQKSQNEIMNNLVDRSI